MRHLLPALLLLSTPLAAQATVAIQAATPFSPLTSEAGAVIVATGSDQLSAGAA